MRGSELPTVGWTGRFHPESEFARLLAAQADEVANAARILGSALRGGNGEVADAVVREHVRRSAAYRRALSQNLDRVFTVRFDRRSMLGLAKNFDETAGSIRTTCWHLGGGGGAGGPEGALEQAELLERLCTGRAVRVRRPWQAPSDMPHPDAAQAGARALRAASLSRLFGGNRDVSDVLLGRDVHNALAQAVSHAARAATSLDALVASGWPGPRRLAFQS